MSREVIDVEASKLTRHPKIALRLGQFREGKTAEAMLTLEAHMGELQRLRDAAKCAGQLSPAIAAEVKRGELMRFYVKQVESAHVNKFSHMSDEELEAFIRDGVAVSAVHNAAATSRLVEQHARGRSSTPIAWFQRAHETRREKHWNH